MRMGYHGMLGYDPENVRGKKLDGRVLRRAWVFARPYRVMIFAFVAVIIVQALISLVPPLLFARIIDEGIANGDRDVVNGVAVLLLLAAVAYAMLSFAERWFSARVGEGLIYELRTTLYDHVQRMPLAFFTHTQTGMLVSRLNNDVIGAQRAVTGTLGQVVANIVAVVSTLITMLVLDWRLTLFALVVLPVFAIPAKAVGRHLQKLTRQQMELNAEMNTTMTERFSVSGAQLVKLFGRHDEEVDQFSDRAGRVRNMGVRSAMYGRTFFIALELVAAVGIALIYWIGGLFAISGSIQAGTLVAMALLINRVYGPLTALTSARVDIMTAVVSFERVFDVLDTPRAIDDGAAAVDLVDAKGDITFSDVTFRYPSSTSSQLGANGADGESMPDVLHHISIDIDAGSMIALVGPSGAGKTTVAALITRLYDVSDGAVLIDGSDVRALTQQSLRDAIGVVTQDPHLFHDTVAANLLYARPGATNAEIVAACSGARIHKVIAALPEGYDTVVGERGYRLSGGEKQRLAIARVLLKNPAIVILDEATSHLDAENEALVQQALDLALEGRTSLVIAHRLSTVRAADRIVVIDEGRIVQVGNHDTLVADGGLYADLYNTLLRGERGLTHS